ncbi:hypothetical protein [Kineosporia sp. NBRC 101677]|nr:hypothetical protein [Kineosporia sp. NBRC 101677]
MSHSTVAGGSVVGTAQALQEARAEMEAASCSNAGSAMTTLRSFGISRVR